MVVLGRVEGGVEELAIGELDAAGAVGGLGVGGGEHRAGVAGVLGVGPGQGAEALVDGGAVGGELLAHVQLDRRLAAGEQDDRRHRAQHPDHGPATPHGDLPVSDCRLPVLPDPSTARRRVGRAGG